MKSLNKGGLIAALVLTFGEQANGSNITTGTLGINSISALSPTGSGLPLAGTGIRIGQTEEGRPALIGRDTATNADVQPTAITYYDGLAVMMDDADMDLDGGHPTRVASVMISTDMTDSSTPAKH